MTQLSDFFHMIAISTSVPVLAALCFGLMAAIGPCTMASNIAALAYIGRDATKRWYTLIESFAYMLGSVLALSLLGLAIILIGLEANAIQNFVEMLGTYVLGPLLIVAGILMLFSDKLKFSTSGVTSSLTEKVKDKGILGSFIMGLIMGFSFCPYSAILFFIVTIPMALTTKGGVVLPVFYAIGTALPVVAFTILLALGFQFAYKWISKISDFEKYLKIIMAILFIAVGIYYVIQIF
jgi:cytochrome c biogenesis protein CcdA